MIKQLIIPFILFITINSFAQEERKVDAYRNKGYFNITRFSYINVNEAKLETYSPTYGVIVTGLPVDKATAYSLQTINGYFISPYFSAGIGVGLDGYANPTINTLPIFLDFRLYLDDYISSMYLCLDFGTLLKIKNGTKGGRMLNLGIGYKLPLKKNRFIIVTDISYSLKQISYDGQLIRTSDNKILIKGIMLSLGVIF